VRKLVKIAAYSGLGAWRRALGSGALVACTGPTDADTLSLVRSLPSSAISLALVLGGALGCAACRSSEPASRDQAQPQAEAARAPSSAAPTEPRPQPPPDPERADKLRDLDDMCKAVDHDYADGTLRDYYSGLRLRTAWGLGLRQIGEASIQPGHTLERAADELSVEPGDPAVEHCTKLFDYLDEVE
jgi:hypothetical protein